MLLSVATAAGLAGSSDGEVGPLGDPVATFVTLSCMLPFSVVTFFDCPVPFEAPTLPQPLGAHLTRGLRSHGVGQDEVPGCQAVSGLLPQLQSSGGPISRLWGWDTAPRGLGGST